MASSYWNLYPLDVAGPTSIASMTFWRRSPRKTCTRKPILDMLWATNNGKHNESTRQRGCCVARFRPAGRARAGTTATCSYFVTGQIQRQDFSGDSMPNNHQGEG